MERSQVSRPIPANCIPEMTVVPLQLSDESDMNDPSIFVFPSCTRVKRCGGCCGSHLLSCQPVEKTTTKYQVIQITQMIKTILIKTKHRNFRSKGPEITIPRKRKNQILGP